MTTTDICSGPVAGVDEAGRGPLAGPVVAAAVVLDPHRPIAGLADSKQLSARRRESLAEAIRARATAWGLAVVGPDDIDRLNILQATFRAMHEALDALSLDPVLVRIDGNRGPELPWPVQTVVGGDRLDRAISAASILAKVHRDELMLELHQRWPQYGFDRHKGYPTRAHLAALELHGPCQAHRRSFRPVHQASLF
ncbi:ribonuclease HII [Wenzhouxiangella sp. EGI_FJ10409]|uniref:ribonuclease HII n=1 Tax=Wenzhouxiangella sp. EGI_FJ10409 TaxID=3243767 RepID=UPI0035DC8B83